MAVNRAAPISRSWFRRLPRWVWIPVAAAIVIIIVLLILRSRTPTVDLATVTRGEAIAAVYAPGTVLSGTQTVIASTAGSRIVTLLVQRGDTVARGQVVAQLESTQPRLQLAQARSELETAQAQLSQISEPGDPYAVAQARAQLAQAQADYRRALEGVRAANAALRGARSQVDQTRAAINAARARVVTAQRNVNIQQSQQRTAQQQVRVAQAQVTRAQATLENAQDNLRRQQNLYAEGAVPQRQVVNAQTAVRSAEADVAQAQANVGATQRQVEQAEAGIDAARGQVDEANSGVDEARAALATAQDAVSSTEAQVAQARAQADAAREQISVAQARLSQTQRGERSSAVQVARTRVQAARAAVAQVEDTLSKYTVRSLVNGTISNVPVQVGDFVPLGGVVANVVSRSQLYVQADVDEADIGPVEIGQTTYFTTDALPDRSYQGVVAQVGASADTETNTYPVEIRTIADSSGLRVNMSLDVNIVTARNPSALLVPASAVVTEPRPHVWMVDAIYRLREQPVTVGVRDTAGVRVEIRSGLMDSDRIVTNPQPSFRSGRRVRVRTLYLTR